MKPRGLFLLIAFVFGGLFAEGCSSDSSSGGGGASCQDLTGSWSLSGSCPTTSCEVTTSSTCTVKVTCNDGSSLSGSISGKDFSLNGTSSCSGSVSGTSASLSCTSNTGTCSSSLTCVSGDCLDPKTIGGGSVDLGVFCNKCAACVGPDFSEGFCDPFVNSDGSFNTSACTVSGDVGDLDNPNASAAQVNGWSCADFDSNE